jgi:hypothetical protein
VCAHFTRGWPVRYSCNWELNCERRHVAFNVNTWIGVGVKPLGSGCVSSIACVSWIVIRDGLLACRFRYRNLGAQIVREDKNSAWCRRISLNSFDAKVK